MNSSPVLADVNTLNQITQTLRNCHAIRVSVYSRIFNAVIWFVIITVFGLILYTLYKNKKPPVDRAWQQKQEEEFIMHQIQVYRDQAQNPNHVNGVPIAVMSNGRIPDAGSASSRGELNPMVYNPKVF